MIRFNEQLSALQLSSETDVFYFIPKPDITADELALCFGPLVMGSADMVLRLPPSVQRHFRREPNFGPARQFPTYEPPTSGPIFPQRMGDPADLIHDARRDVMLPGKLIETANKELAAVSGLPITERWTLIAPVAWPGVSDFEMGLCWRKRAERTNEREA